MEFTYSFVVNSRPSHRGIVRLPLVNGMVKFGQFRPDEILNKNFHHPAIVGITHYETADEFRNDCMVIVNQVNLTILASDLYSSFNNALKFIIENHIRRCGRLFINDLMSYIDTYSELLLAIGIDRKTVKDQYPTILYILAHTYSTYVLEAFNAPDGRNIPFMSSPRYTNLRSYIAKINPQLVR